MNQGEVRNSEWKEKKQSFWWKYLILFAFWQYQSPNFSSVSPVCWEEGPEIFKRLTTKILACSNYITSFLDTPILHRHTTLRITTVFNVSRSGIWLSMSVSFTSHVVSNSPTLCSLSRDLCLPGRAVLRARGREKWLFVVKLQLLPTFPVPYACQTGIQAFKTGVSLSLMKII